MNAHEFYRTFGSFGTNPPPPPDPDGKLVPDDQFPRNAKLCAPRTIVERKVYYPWAETSYDPKYTSRQINKEDRTSRRQYEALVGEFPWMNPEVVKETAPQCASAPSAKKKPRKDGGATAKPATAPKRPVPTSSTASRAAPTSTRKRRKP